MKLTTNLKKYLLFSILWSVAFFSVLHWALFRPEQRWPIIVAAATCYGIGFAIVGLVLGKLDPAHKSRLNLGLGYYFVSNLTSLIVGGLWILFYRTDKWLTLVLMVLAFTGFSAIAYFSSRGTVKGIEKNKLFQ